MQICGLELSVQTGLYIYFLVLPLDRGIVSYTRVAHVGVRLRYFPLFKIIYTHVVHDGSVDCWKTSWLQV